MLFGHDKDVAFLMENNRALYDILEQYRSHFAEVFVDADKKKVTLIKTFRSNGKGNKSATTCKGVFSY